MFAKLRGLFPYSSEAIKENKADFSSQQNFKEEFATILEALRASPKSPREEIMNSQTSAKAAPLSDKEPARNNVPSIGITVGTERLTASKTSRTTGKKFKGQQNQLYQQQMLLMPLLQFSMPKATQNIIQSKIGTSVPVESSVFPYEYGTAGNFISENQLTFKNFSLGEPMLKGTEGFVSNSPFESQEVDDVTDVSVFFENNLKSEFTLDIEKIPKGFAENPKSFQLRTVRYAHRRLRLTGAFAGSQPLLFAVLEQFRQAEYLVPFFRKIVSQAFYESGISKEELHDVSLALLLQNKKEKNIVISGKTKSCVVVCIAGIDAEKTRQLFLKAETKLLHQLEQIVDYKSSNKTEGSRFGSNDPKKEPVIESNGLTWLIRPQFDRNMIMIDPSQGFHLQNEQPNLSDVSPADVITQIGREIDINLKTGLKELIVQLKPEHLGSVTLKVSMMEGVLAVDISTENAAVKSIIESHIHELRQTLIHRGMEVGQLNVYGEGNMSGFGSQSGMFYSHAQDSRGDSQNPQLLDEAWEQESLFARQTAIDLWM